MEFSKFFFNKKWKIDFIMMEINLWMVVIQSNLFFIPKDFKNR